MQNGSFSRVLFVTTSAAALWLLNSSKSFSEPINFALLRDPVFVAAIARQDSTRDARAAQAELASIHSERPSATLQNASIPPVRKAPPREPPQKERPRVRLNDPAALPTWEWQDRVRAAREQRNGNGKRGNFDPRLQPYSARRQLA